MTSIVECRTSATALRVEGHWDRIQVACNLPVLVISTEPVMKNPWGKKNPFMSMWLSGVNSVVGTARSRVTAEGHRQAARARAEGQRQVLRSWAGGTFGATKESAATKSATKKSKKSG